MTPSRLLIVSAFALAIVSCKPTGGPTADNPYDAPQTGAAQGGAVAAAPTQGSNPVYDTPAAYEESTGATPAPEAIVDPGMSAPRSTHPSNNKPAAPKPSSAVAAGGTVHTVVAGDTLGGIAKKYGVTQDAIKKANNMTKDTVVLGKKMQIPGR